MDKKKLIDTTRTFFVVECPGCKQKLGLQGILLQTEEELACAQCNALFRLEIDNKKAKPYLVSPPSGAPIGPAEGKVRH